MYYLLYDQCVFEPKHKRFVSRLETHLTDYSIPYKTGRVDLLKNLDELLNIAHRNKAHTIVAVGPDSHIAKVASAVAKRGDFTLGVAPLEKKSTIGSFLGIPSHQEKIYETLSARKIETMDLGNINNSHFFLMSLETQTVHRIVLSIESSYHITPLPGSQCVGVYNFQYHHPHAHPTCHPQDGFLNVIVVPAKETNLPLQKTKPLEWEKETVIPVRSVSFLSVDNEPVELVADKTQIFQTPLSVSIAPRALPVIVGKDRRF